MVFTDTGMIFIEGNIQTIVKTVFDSPMLSHGMGKYIHTLQ